MGEDGCGVVYMAEQEPVRRKVAHKVVKLGMDNRARNAWSHNQAGEKGLRIDNGKDSLLISAIVCVTDNQIVTTK